MPDEAVPEMRDPNASLPAADRRALRRMWRQFHFPDLSCRLFALDRQHDADIPAQRRATLYIPKHESVYAHFAGQMREVEAGGLVVCTNGEAHRLSLSPTQKESVTGEPPSWRMGAPAPEWWSEKRHYALHTFISGYTDLMYPHLVPPFLVLTKADVAQTPGLADLMKAICNPDLYAWPQSTLIAARIGATIAVMLMTWSLKQAAAEGVNLLEGLNDSRIRRALHEIRKDPSRPWTLAEMAEEARLSRNRFALRFKAEVGEAPGAFLKRYRLALAAEYLAAQDWSVERISQSVGYQSVQAFTKSFRQHYGVSPGRYRSAVRRGEIAQETFSL